MKYIFPFSIFILMCVGVLSGQNYALFFAVNEYDNMRNLSNPIKDAKTIAEDLERSYNFKTEVVENPTLEIIEDKLSEYSRKFASEALSPDGQLLIYFTGHGLVAFKNGFFMGKDADPKKVTRSALGYEYWRPFINSIPCKHILVAIDACFSGTFDPSWYSKNSEKFNRPGELGEGEKLLSDHAKYTTRLFITSATEEESPDKSSFAKKFREGLFSRGGNDGILTFTELYSFIELASPKPHNGDFGDDEPGSSFLFVEKEPDIDMNQVKSSREDLNAWNKAEAQNTVAAYKAYLQSFSNGRFAYRARRAIQQLDEEAWDLARQSNTINAYEHYLNNFPKGQYANSAQRNIQTIADDTEWEIAQKLNDKTAYEEYVRKYPRGRHTEEANKKIRAIENANSGSKEEPPSTKGSSSNTAIVKTAATSFTTSDGNTYAFKTMKDGKRWMTQNLNIKIQDSYCYEDKEENCRKYGRLYTFKAAKKDADYWGMVGDYRRIMNGARWLKNMVVQMMMPVMMAKRLIMLYFKMGVVVLRPF